MGVGDARAPAAGPIVRVPGIRVVAGHRGELRCYATLSREPSAIWWSAFVRATEQERAAPSETRLVGNKLYFRTSTTSLTAHVRTIDRAMHCADASLDVPR
jgi:hypothetical protein